MLYITRHESPDIIDPASATGTELAGATAFKDMDAFLPTVMSLLRNVSYIALSVTESSEMFLLAGMAAFMPKILENQFKISSSAASMFVGE